MQHLQNNTSGYYMLVNMNQHQNNTEKNSIIGFASNAIMVSKTFNPPPSVHGNPDSAYRNSCVVRFFIHQFGKNPSRSPGWLQLLGCAAESEESLLQRL